MQSTISVGENPINSSRLTPLVILSWLVLSISVLLSASVQAKLHAVSWQSPVDIDLPIVAPPQGGLKSPSDFKLTSVDENSLRGVSGQGLFGDIMQDVGEGSELTSELVDILDSAMPLFNMFQADISVTGVSGDMSVDVNLAEGEFVIQLPSHIDEIALTNFGVKGSENSFGDIYLRDINLGDSQLRIKFN